MIERKLKSKSARSILFEEFNDIDIYVEDSAVGYKKIYKELLNKAFENKVKIEHIIPIGDREQVIKECRNNQDNINRKRVYIVDGDLYLLSVNQPNPINGLYVLPRYCIENYLVSKNSLIKVLYEDEPELEKNEIENRMDFQEWLSKNEKPLLSLFILYSLCKRYCPEIQTVAYKVNKLCSDATGTVCPIKTEKRIIELKSHLENKIGKIKSEKEISILEEKLEKEENTFIKYISGKDYFLPLLFARIKNKVRSTSDPLNLKLRLAIHTEFNDLKTLPDFVIE